MSVILKGEHLCRQFGSGNNTVHAVKDVSIAIESGKLTVLRGRSGSGKTTLINLLSTLDSATSGTLLYEGKDLMRLPSAERDTYRREEIAIIFQSVALMSEMTAYENVEFGLRIAKVPGKERKQRVENSLALVGLQKRMTHLPDELSGGEQQRIAIARAISHEPKIIFADEPTAELDSLTAVQIVRLFKQIAREQNIGIVMTTHDPAMMEFADIVYTMQNGEIVENE